MSIVVESTSTATTTSSATLVITKPTGVAVGDLLVAVIGAYNTTVTTLAGWTLLRNQTCTNGMVNIQFKVADSGDVSASNYTFTFADAARLKNISMLRLSNQSGVSPFQYDIGDFNNAAGGTSISFTASVTPRNGSLLIANFHVNDTGGPNNIATVSGYFATGQTATWTELHDTGQDVGTDDPTNAAAYALVTTGTAITAFGGTTSFNRDNQAGIFAVINARVNATGSNDLVITSATSFAQAGTAGTVGTNTLATASTQSFTQGGQGTSPTQWSNESKPSTTWTNPDK